MSGRGLGLFLNGTAVGVGVKIVNDCWNNDCIVNAKLDLALIILVILGTTLISYSGMLSPKGRPKL